MPIFSLPQLRRTSTTLLAFPMQLERPPIFAQNLIEICCGHNNLHNILIGLPLELQSFLMKYLGLPFRFGNYGEWVFSILRIKYPTTFLLGMENS
jgi:hypothetical protein